jgi:hypothetical protein
MAKRGKMSKNITKKQNSGVLPGELLYFNNFRFVGAVNFRDLSSILNLPLMRIAVQSVLFLLLSHFSFASSMAPALKLDTTVAEKNVVDHSKLYFKGKGTAGLIAGLTLGPVGILGTHLFSHNLAVRKKAVKGCEILGTVVLVAALSVLLIYSLKGGGHHSGGGRVSGSRGGGHHGPNLGHLDIDLDHSSRCQEKDPCNISELPLFLQP